MSSKLLPANLRLGGVELQIADLNRSVEWYSSVLGAQLKYRDSNTAVLGSLGNDTPLLTLHERSGAEPMPQRGKLGLYHVAWLLPDRASLGRFLIHLAESNERVGSADHLVSEALYLTDPDGLGVEVYADRPRSRWRSEGGQIQMATLALDVNGLMEAAGEHPWVGLPLGTSIGHIHLHIGSIELAAQFYSDVIGFEITQSSYPGALFMSAGGYHHHLGNNTWAGGNAIPPNEDDAQLLMWNIVLPDTSSLDALRKRAENAGVKVSLQDDGSLILKDPWSISLRISVTI